MAVDKYGKQYCINNLVMMIVETIQMKRPDLDSNTILEQFTRSRTYGLLYDTETGLWTEGPDYIIGLWREEQTQMGLFSKHPQE